MGTFLFRVFLGGLLVLLAGWPLAAQEIDSEILNEKSEYTPELVVRTPVSLSADSQASRAPAPLPRLKFFVQNWTRFSQWDFFDPGVGGGESNYNYTSNRLRLGMSWVMPRVEVNVVGQYVQFGGLPRNATGPGLLGLGAAYFGHSGDTWSRQAYLRYANVKLKNVADSGVSLQFGRFGFNGGLETVTENKKIQTLKRIRISQKLIGEFGWSIYQRSYDGVRADWKNNFGNLTLAAFRPTQGGFEEVAGTTINEIDTYIAAWTVPSGQWLPHNEVQLFFYKVDDERPVTGRPDNSGRGAPNGVNLDVNNFGFSVVGAYPVGQGEADSLVWVSLQNGSWYEQQHRASALALEGGYQWKDLPWTPWVRGGYMRSSGDRDPSDEKHGTFFQMLPTSRIYSLSTTYNLMNNTDVFTQVFLQPRSDLKLRVDFHHIRLTEASDRWYFGAGAGQARGTIFGFGGRSSNGFNGFGNVLEGEVEYQVNKYWFVKAYLSHIFGGNVVRTTFSGDQMNFIFLENILRF